MMHKATFINVVLCQILYCTASYRESVVLLHVCASIRMTYGCFSWYRKPVEVCYHHSYCIVRHNIVLYRTVIYQEFLILLYICALTWIYAYICICMYVSVCVQWHIWKVPNVCISCILALLFFILLIFFIYHVLLLLFIFFLLLLSLLLSFIYFLLSCFCFPVWL